MHEANDYGREFSENVFQRQYKTRVICLAMVWFRGRPENGVRPQRSAKRFHEYLPNVKKIFRFFC